MKRALAAICVAAAAVACQSPTDDPTSTVPAKCAVEQPLIAPQKLDVLFVIDNSISMKEEQQGVADNLNAFVSKLATSGGVAQDFRIGVITTGVYQQVLENGLQLRKYWPNESGKLQPVPDAAGQPTAERMLTGEDPELIAKFARLVKQGTAGSGQETPFEAVRLALTDEAARPLEEGGNGGFFRDRARLLIFVLSDEDDCSEINRPPKTNVGPDKSVDYCHNEKAVLTPVQTYFDAIRSATDSTGATREIVWATIGPVSNKDKHAESVLDLSVPPTGQVRNVDCPTSQESGPRHLEMASLWRGGKDLDNLASICQPSYRDTLEAVAGLAGVPQVLELANVPDPDLLNITITRNNGTKQACTRSNGGLTEWDPPSNGQLGRIHFGGDCVRHADDQAVQIRMLCAG